MNDLMRLPLGILSGMGFIGAGAIVRRDNFVVGITTAATLWFVTVLGLCFGGGQIAIGLVGSAIGLVVLTALKVVEDRMKQDRQGKLSLVVDSSGPSENEIRSSLKQGGIKVASCAFAHTSEARTTELNCDLHWSAPADDNEVPAAIHALAERPGAIRIAWMPQAK